MKIFSIILFISVCCIVFCGCGSKTTVPLCPNVAEAQVVEKVIAVPCQIPEITCDFSGENYMPTRKLIECISLQKEAIRICNETVEVEDEDK